MLSKRKLNNLVVENKVSGWTDPVMPTISGLRNRGYTSTILRDFIMRSGFAKANSVIEKFTLEDTVRDNLNPTAKRTMAIIDPVPLFIDNFDIITDTLISCPNHPKEETLGHRELHLSETIFVERDDIRKEAEPDFWRIYPGNWVRLKHGYNVLIKEVLADENGIIIKVIAEIDAGSKNMKMATHKAKVALHWLSIHDSRDMEAHFYGDLCDSEGNYLETALTKKNIKVEHYLLNENDVHYEFERNGYFYISNHIAHNLSPLKNNNKK